MNRHGFFIKYISDKNLYKSIKMRYYVYYSDRKREEELWNGQEDEEM